MTAFKHIKDEKCLKPLNGAINIGLSLKRHPSVLNRRMTDYLSN